jgi:SAM-dependent methyltransferase
MVSTSRITPSDSSRTHERYPVWEGIAPLPPDSLLWSVGGSSVENFLVVADFWDQMIAPYIGPASTVLDIGCGCGRSARALLQHPFVARYIGFDVIAPNIEWCNRFLAPLSAGRAVFLHYDLYSAEYNPGAQTRASELVFPCEDAGANLVIANSVFTHLLEADAVHYLEEIRRTLRSGGHALLSIHVNPAEGRRFSGNETRIDISPDYFVELATAAGLAVERRVDEFCGQMLFIFSRALA